MMSCRKESSAELHKSRLKLGFTELPFTIQAIFAHEFTPPKVVDVGLKPSRSTARVELLTLGPNHQVPSSWGPDRHLGSNWNRPGAEWGTGFTFPVAGCWDLHATSDNAFGDVWLKIV